MMRNLLAGRQRREFDMVLAALDDVDRINLKARTSKVFEGELSHAYAAVFPRWDKNDRPWNCEIIFDPVAMKTIGLDRRLAVAAHEIGHVLTLKKEFGHIRSEGAADLFAHEIGFTKINGLGDYLKAQHDRPLRYRWDMKPDGTSGILIIL
jgi:hypothetical protein